MDPLALLPYALAAAGGRLGPYDTAALVAAGVTLLQRSAPLVRALRARRSAVLLPAGPAWVVALAASDGRGMVMLDAAQSHTAADLSRANVGAVFTIAELAAQLPPTYPRVLLEHAPQAAELHIDGRALRIDLGSHFGLDLVGDSSGPGAPEECLVFGVTGAPLTHAHILATAWEVARAQHFTTVDRTLSVVSPTDLGTLATGVVAPLLVGGRVRCLTTASAADVTGALRDMDATMLVAPAHLVEGMHRTPDGQAALEPLKRIVVVP